MTTITKIWPFAGLSQSRRGDSNPGPLHYEAWAGVGRSGSDAGICRQDGRSRVADVADEEPVWRREASTWLPYDRSLRLTDGRLFIDSAPAVAGDLDASQRSADQRWRRLDSPRRINSLIDRSSSTGRSSTPDLGAVWMAARKSGVPAGGGVGNAKHPARCRIRRLIANRMSPATACGRSRMCLHGMHATCCC